MKKFLNFLRYKLWLLPGILGVLFLILIGISYLFGVTDFLNIIGIIILILLVLFGVGGAIYGYVMAIKEKKK